MTIKATSLLSIIAIWVTMLPAVIAEPGGWWGLIFAFLATGSIGIGAWRRLGLSRLIAISGVWLGTAIAIADNSDNTWISVFAFLATGAIVYSIMKRDAYLGGVGIAVAWVMTGAVAVDSNSDAAWICIFAFLTAGAVANSFKKNTRGIVAAVAWGAVGVLMLAADGFYWTAIFAFIASATSFWMGGGINLPRSFEWDFFDRDDDGERVKVVH